MKPYQENVSMTQQFNYRHSRVSMVVENSFGRLKGRWKCLLKRIDILASNVPYIVGASTICVRYTATIVLMYG